MKNQPTLSNLHSSPYWEAITNLGSEELSQFINSVEELCTSFDSLHKNTMQYAELLSDKEMLMSMPVDIDNRPTIEHIQKLTRVYKSLAADLENTIDILIEEGIPEKVEENTYERNPFEISLSMEPR